ncbi:8989_t:CDS:2 [Ambispora gerdemannii]|uniref:deoxyhypusine synthase n=1 Tax=Ambispora gerdemannii TaxID=144530 RepID=A0A9N9DK20_9GLOM|nr:8989_t:CDS:2 [Ambispora gerdemannii]
MKENNVPETIKQAVLTQSTPMSIDAIKVTGPDFNTKLELSDIIGSYARMGFQATSVSQGVEIINQMRKWRLSDDPILPDEIDEFKDFEKRATTKCKIFFGYTSNLVSSGLREVFRFLVQHSLVDVIVTTAGGVEEDIIKCLANTYIGDFSLKGATLRDQGLNRVGNLLIPNQNYCLFEDWVSPILYRMVAEQKEEGVIWSPSKIIHRLGKEIDNPESIYHWAYKNNIPVYCPAITDGSLGDMIYFHSFKDPGLIIDIVSDIRSLNDQAVFAKKTGIIILGGGVVKHHICNANLMRNGADYAVYINTGQEFDGSDAGARPDEAVSWGKIRADGEMVKIYADATIVFPLIVAETFAKNFHNDENLE